MVTVLPSWSVKAIWILRRLAGQISKFSSGDRHGGFSAMSPIENTTIGMAGMGAIAIGDFNHDGVPDLAIGCNTSFARICPTNQGCLTSIQPVSSTTCARPPVFRNSPPSFWL